MKLKNSLYALAIAGACASSAYAQSYSILFSNFNGSSAAFTDITPNATQVKLDFTLNATGAVTESNLVDWTVSLLDSSSTVLWTDNVVVSGVIQTLGGVSRSAANRIDFNFNTGTQVMGTYDNMVLGGNLNNRSSGGTVYNVFSTGTGTLDIFRSRQNTSNIDPIQSFTVTAGGAVTPVPEASGSVAGLGLAVAGLYQLGRRRRNTVTQ